MLVSIAQEMMNLEILQQMPTACRHLQKLVRNHREAVISSIPSIAGQQGRAERGLLT
jgi:hypothetical protein